MMCVVHGVRYDLAGVQLVVQGCEALDVGKPALMCL